MIDYIAMDIKVPLEKYNTMGASPSDQEGIAKSVVFLLTHPIPYEFRTTIHSNWLSEENIEKISEWVAPAKFLTLQPFTPSKKVLNPNACNGPGYEKEKLLAFRAILTGTIVEIFVRSL